eukprot:scaffold644_cov357-Pavlova_lutheri.AAC.17
MALPPPALHVGAVVQFLQEHRSLASTSSRGRFVDKEVWPTVWPGLLKSQPGTPVSIAQTAIGVLSQKRGCKSGQKERNGRLPVSYTPLRSPPRILAWTRAFAAISNAGTDVLFCLSDPALILLHLLDVSSAPPPPV